MRPTSILLTAAILLLAGAAVVPVGAQETVDVGALGEHHLAAAELLQRVDSEEEALLVMLAGGREMPPRALAVLRHGQGFRAQVLDALAGPLALRPVRLREAIDRYLARGEVALPAQPKSMDVLYDHEGALAFRTAHPGEKGRLWSAHWYRLALTEPLADLADPAERAAGVDTVAARYGAKLVQGEPPHTYPSELPLAPAIAPGLILASPEAAMIWDNLAMFTEVLADILVHAGPGETSAAIEAAIDHFVAHGVAVTGQVMWETMALRHGIFFQGGFPIAVMTESERNVHSHGMHMRSGARAVIPGMMRR
jgi:hypothetical protein